MKQDIKDKVLTYAHFASVPFFSTIIAWTVYIYCLPPTITGEDAGELITAAYTLGIPHPPGYPLWCLLAHPFRYLPWGDDAWRMHFSSAFSAALCIALIAYLAEKITRNKLAAFAAALALAFSREFWEQAIIAEVYALNALLITACLLLLWQWYESRASRNLWALSVIFGLGLANHNTFILLAPVFALWVFWVDGTPWKSWRMYFGLAICACFIAICVYLYLPLRSMENPAMDWGNPETLNHWMRHVFREQYTFMLTENPRTFERFLGQFCALLNEVVYEFTPAVFTPIIIGIIGLYDKKQRYSILLMAMSVFVFIGFILIQNPNNDREWLTVMSVFMIPIYLYFALGIAWAIQATYKRMGRIAALILALFVTLSPLIWNLEHNNRRHDYWTLDYLNNILGGMAPKAIFIPTMDHSTFGTTYMQVVEGVRPDITLGRKYGYIEVTLTEGMPPEKLAKFGDFPPRRYDPEIIAWVLEHTSRPVYVDTYTKIPGVTCSPAGMIYRLLREGESDPWDYWAGYRWHSFKNKDTHGDYTADLILGQYYFAKARDAFAETSPSAGKEYLESALEATGRDALFLNWAGVTAARGGEYGIAESYFEKAHQFRPDNVEITENYERVKKKLYHQ